MPARAGVGASISSGFTPDVAAVVRVAGEVELRVMGRYRGAVTLRCAGAPDCEACQPAARISAPVAPSVGIRYGVGLIVRIRDRPLWSVVGATPRP
jgi:hypothetical protein